MSEKSSDTLGALYATQIHYGHENPPQFLIDLASQPDDTPILLNPLEQTLAMQSDSYHLAWSISELRALASRILPNLEPDAIEKEIEHEGQHNSASRDLGAVLLGYSLCVEREVIDDENGVVQVTAQMRAKAIDFKTTKLGLALVTAHPAVLSPSDLRDINVMGYTIEALADKAIDHNSKWLNRVRASRLPIPLSYSS